MVGSTQATGGFISPISDAQAKILLGVALFLIAGSRLLALAAGRDPGFDQSMLLSNFPLGSYGQYFKPLPFFEQTAPLGVVMILDQLSAAFGREGHGRILAIRSAAIVAACIAYVVFYQTLRPYFGPAISVLAVTLTASSTEALVFTTNAKHYVYEFLASVLMIAAALRFLEKPNRQGALAYLAAAAFTIVFAFTAPLILAIAGGALVVSVLARQTGPLHARLFAPDMVRTLALTGIAVAAASLFYLLYTRAVTALDFAAYAASDVSTFIRLQTPFFSTNAEIFSYLLKIFYRLAEPTFVHITIWHLQIYEFRSFIWMGFLLISLLGVVLVWRRSLFFGAGVTAGVTGILILNIAGMLPFTGVRHFMFLSPFTVPCFALGAVAIIGSLLRWCGRESWMFVIVLLIVAACGLAASQRATKLESHQVSDYLSRTERIAAPIWLYYGAQPSVRALRPSLIEAGAPGVLGLLDHQSTSSSWLVPARDDGLSLTNEAYLRRTSAALAGTGPIWLLLTHTAVERRVENGRFRYLWMAMAKGRECWWAEGGGAVLAFCALPADLPRAELAGLSMKPVPKRPPPGWRAP